VFFLIDLDGLDVWFSQGKLDIDFSVYGRNQNTSFKLSRHFSSFDFEKQNSYLLTCEKLFCTMPYKKPIFSIQFALENLQLLSSYPESVNERKFCKEKF